MPPLRHYCCHFHAAADIFRHYADADMPPDYAAIRHCCHTRLPPLPLGLGFLPLLYWLAAWLPRWAAMRCRRHGADARRRRSMPPLSPPGSRQYFRCRRFSPPPPLLGFAGPLHCCLPG